MSERKDCFECGAAQGEQHHKGCSCFGFTMRVGPLRKPPHRVIMACQHGVDFRQFCYTCDTQPLRGIEMGPTVDQLRDDYGPGLKAAFPPVQGVLPVSSEARKGIPIATGCLDYFPDALAEIARLSRIGNDKHSPGQPLHWSRDKSNDHPDCMIRHFFQRGTMDTSGAEPVLHSVEMAWRALAIAQLEIEGRRAEAEARNRGC